MRTSSILSVVRKKRNLYGLSKTSKTMELISYYHLLQFSVPLSNKLTLCTIKKGKKIKRYKKNKHLKKLVKNAWDGKPQILLYTISKDIDNYYGHALMVLPNVVDRFRSTGIYVLRAYDCESPGRSAAIIVHRNGKVSIDRHGSNGPINCTEFLFSAKSKIWKGKNINGK